MSDDTVRLEPWTEADLAVELRNNTPEMTAFPGGRLEEGVVRRRHERFLRGQADGAIAPFSLHTDAEREAIGAAGYWQTEHGGHPVYECGWFVFPRIPGQRVRAPRHPCASGTCGDAR